MSILRNRYNPMKNRNSGLHCLQLWQTICRKSLLVRTRPTCPKIDNNVMNTLAPSFLIGSSLFLQVARTTIKLPTSSKFGQIGLRATELAAIERLKKP